MRGPALDGPAGGARARRRPAVYRGTPYFAEIRRRKAAWFEQVEVKSGSDATPMTMARAVREVQAATREDAIVVTGAGLPQGMVKQRWVTRRPRTHLTSGGFSTMGFTLPAAIGAQLAQPDAPGPRDLRRRRLPPDDAGAPGGGPGRHAGLHGRPRQLGLDQHQGRPAGRSSAAPPCTDFLTPTARPTRPDFAAIGRAFGIHAESRRRPRRGRAGRRARARLGRPVARPREASIATSRWPGPTRPAGGTPRARTNHPEQHARWLAGGAEEQHR